jgi:lipopolysaccharide exporter
VSRSVSTAVGVLIVVGMRWTDRLIGLVSTMVLARLLVPEDFGIIAMASLVIGLIDVLLDMGVNITLIQNKDATQDDYDAAWTLRLLQSALASALIVVAAHPAAAYFHDLRLSSVIQVLAVSVLLAGCENIGIVSFQKKMEFGREFRFFFARRLIGFLITMAAAWYLQSYWALVIGTLAARLAAVVLSYALHPMRPRLSWVRMIPMLTFSSWNLLRGTSCYLAENLHRLLVGRRESTPVMGSYALASDIAAMPSVELLAPLNRVLFPLLVAVKDDPPQLKRVFLLAIAVQALIGVPAGAGLALVAHEAVRALLGERWMAAVPFIQIMGCINIVSALSVSGGYVLLAMGRAKVTALHAWGQVLMFAVLAEALIPTGGAMAIAGLRLAVATAGLLSFIYLIGREQPSWRLLDVLRCVWRPCAAAAVMGLVLLGLPSMAHWPVLLPLLLKSGLGALVYGATVLALWLIGGRPDGAEAYLLGKFKRLRKGRAGPA